VQAIERRWSTAGRLPLFVLRALCLDVHLALKFYESVVAEAKAYFVEFPNLSVRSNWRGGFPSGPQLTPPGAC
jgi:hypothetical protein